MKPRINCLYSERGRYAVGFRLLCVIACLTLLGCVQSARVKPIYVNLVRGPIQTESEPGEPSRQDERPSIGIIRLTDDRSNKKTVGSIIGPVVCTSDLLAWVLGGFHGLEREGYRVFDNDPSPAQVHSGIDLEISVTRVNCRSQRTLLRGSVVIRVTFHEGDAVLGQRLYRGDGIREDNSIFESSYKFKGKDVLVVLNAALTDAVSKTETDLEQFIRDVEPK